VNNEEILNNGEKKQNKKKILCEIEEKKCFIVTVFLSCEATTSQYNCVIENTVTKV